MPSGITAWLWLKGMHPALPGWPCPLRALTGIPCPTCFLTRAIGAALCGDLAGAVQLHAFGPPTATLLLVWSVAALRHRRLLPPPLHRALRAAPAVATLTALLAYWAVRLGLQSFPGQAPSPSG